MANWSLPSLTDLYTNFLTYIKARDDDAVRMNDSRSTAATNLPDYAKRWNATTQTFQNWLSAAWSSIVLAVAGGGTGATTAAGARTNLDVYSKDEADALFVTELTTGETVLASNVTLSTDETYYDGPTVSLSAGTWFIVGVLNLNFPTGYVPVAYCRIWDGTTTISEGIIAAPSIAGTYRVAVPMNDIIVLGATTTIRLSAKRSGGSSSTYIAGTYSYIRAVKIG